MAGPSRLGGSAVGGRRRPHPRRRRRSSCPPDTVGSIWMRNVRPFVYHNDPDKTAANRRGDYVTVGDLGSLDADGFLYLADRRTDLILSGGVNVYPAEIEAALLAHPGVADAGVVGIPDADLGEVVYAVVARSARATGWSRRCTPTSPASWPASSAPARSSCAMPCRAARPASCCAACCATRSLPPAIDLLLGCRPCPHRSHLPRSQLGRSRTGATCSAAWRRRSAAPRSVPPARSSPGSPRPLTRPTTTRTSTSATPPSSTSR